MPTSTAPALFTPIKLGQHVLNHRVVLAPMSRVRADLNGLPTADVTQYYEQRTTKGSLIITEGTGISPGAGCFANTPGIHTDDQIKAWKEVTTAIHKAGGIVFLQIAHLGRATFSAALPDGQSLVSASDVAIQGNSPFGLPYEKPRALTVDEIKSITQDFVQAAKNAMTAGFDGVEIHSANGFLLDQFINTSSNKRTDDYGGSIENRARFSLEVVDQVAKAIGDEKTSVRFSPFSGFQDMKDDTPVATWSHIVQQLETLHPHLAYIHFIEPRLDIFADAPAPPEKLSEEGLDYSLDSFRTLWSGPFISSGNYSYSAKSVYERAESSPNNLIAVGRAFISNPDLVERLRHHWQLAPFNRETFYSPGPKGYTDYPTYNSAV